MTLHSSVTKKLASICMAVLALTSCSEIATLTFYSQIIDAENEIQTTIGDARCTDNSQCKVLYLQAVDSCSADTPVAFSDANNIEAQLFELESTRRSNIYQNLLVNGSSTYCSSRPRVNRTASCVNQRCVLN